MQTQDKEIIESSLGSNAAPRNLMGFCHFNTARMKFLEKDLEQIIFETNKTTLYSKGLFLIGKPYRQLRIGNYGIADLVYFQRPKRHLGVDFLRGCITIVELKQNKINVSAFFQALRYAKGISRYLEKRGFSVDDYFDFKIVLIGSEIDLNSDVVYLPDLFKESKYDRFNHHETQTSIELYTYNMDINGLSFKEYFGYSIKNENI